MSNMQTYEEKSVVDEYATLEKLSPPEKRILDLVGKEKGINVLDLGVGGGRTTPYFAKIAKEYVGVDYSSGMIAACKRRFKGSSMTFKVADARDLSGFSKNHFDLVLFSFNGLDYVGVEDRTTILKEIKRVLKKDGFFAFSSHNLQSASHMYSVQFSPNPLKIAWRIFRAFLIILLNGTRLYVRNKDWAILNDGAHRFGLRTFYIKPGSEIKELERAGFGQIKVFSLKTGEEVKKEDITKIDDSWVYYLCRSE